MKIRTALFPLIAVLAASSAASCASSAPFTGAAAKALFPSVEAVVPDWEALEAGGAESGGAGVLAFCSGKIAEPVMEFWAVRACLASPRIRIVVGAGETAGETKKHSGREGETVPGAVSSTFVSGFVRRNGLLAGINASPFDPSSAREGEARRNVGLVVSEGVMIAPPHPPYDAAVFYVDGKGAVVSQADLSGPQAGERILHAAGGFYAVLADGEALERTRKKDARYPRSALGFSRDGYTLYLLVIDGRRAGSGGATEAETALLLRSLGASSGINLDGGGSSAMALRGKDGTVRVVNVPIHGGIPGRERGVAACIGIGADADADGNRGGQGEGQGSAD
ncbi:MAG: phosphodiester glycosidase family protein [Treponema sp.]|jgi:hypothetical protein|nr:phosphodiester glycosidase family protein [Treponema sp.]